MGDRVRVVLNGSYRHYLSGLEGRITSVLHHGAVVALDSDPAARQKVIGTAGAVGPKVPSPHQRIYQFHELERL